jgi:hypothetical protein
MACKRSGVRIPIAPLPVQGTNSNNGYHLFVLSRSHFRRLLRCGRAHFPQVSVMVTGPPHDGREQPGEQDGSAVNAGRQLSGAATSATRCGEPDAEAGLMSSIGFGDDVNWIVEGTNGCLEMHPDHLATAVRECGRHIREMLAVGGWPRQRIGRGRRAVGRRPFPHTQLVRSRA